MLTGLFLIFSVSSSFGHRSPSEPVPEGTNAAQPAKSDANKSTTESHNTLVDVTKGSAELTGKPYIKDLPSLKAKLPTVAPVARPLPNQPNLEDIVQHLLKLDLTHLRTRLGKLSPKVRNISLILREYRRFLIVKRLHRDAHGILLLPVAPVEACWRAHMEDLDSYTAMSLAIGMTFVYVSNNLTWQNERLRKVESYKAVYRDVFFTEPPDENVFTPLPPLGYILPRILRDNSNEERYQITIRPQNISDAEYNKRQLVVDVADTWTVKDLKKTIHCTWGFSPYNQVLKYRGKALEEGPGSDPAKSPYLRDFGITKHSTITLQMRGHGEWQSPDFCARLAARAAE
ncbi:hypothetical protein HK097_000368 [Rhizophlyctis rosea]|uniref:Ubiquitin-like domain-containing protein n=1 Tax=Rhizophlyctis rosea TaxID=64517 RepID=A0AAD5S7H2_9FUNG|nr:hypothetical protein HK097_000368 [Rhizophlyctis rosea]